MGDRRVRARPCLVQLLFEDNAEFGLGFRLTADLHLRLARARLAELREAIGPDTH